MHNVALGQLGERDEKSKYFLDVSWGCQQHAQDEENLQWGEKGHEIMAKILKHEGQELLKDAENDNISIWYNLSYIVQLNFLWPLS